MSRYKEMEKANINKWKIRLGLPKQLDILEKRHKIVEAHAIDIKFIRNLDLNCQEEDYPKVACLIEKTLVKDKAMDKHRYLNE